MKRVGIGGFQLADVDFGSGQTVERKILFGSAEWLEAVRHAAAEADRLGLEMAHLQLAGLVDDGRTVGQARAGDEEARLERDFSRRAAPLHGSLAQPPSNNGPIRDLTTGGRRTGGAAPPPDPTYYGDSAVVAFRTPPEEAPEFHPIVTTSAGAVDVAALLDDNLNTAITLPAPEGGGPAWVQFEFAQSFKARAIRFAGRARNSCRTRTGQRRRCHLPHSGVAARPAALSRGHRADVRVSRDERQVLPSGAHRRAADAGDRHE